MCGSRDQTPIFGYQPENTTLCRLPSNKRCRICIPFRTNWKTYTKTSSYSASCRFQIPTLTIHFPPLFSNNRFLLFQSDSHVHSISWNILHSTDKKDSPSTSVFLSITTPLLLFSTLHSHPIIPSNTFPSFNWTFITHHFSYCPSCLHPSSLPPAFRFRPINGSEHTIQSTPVQLFHFRLIINPLSFSQIHHSNQLKGSENLPSLPLYIE